MVLRAEIIDIPNAVCINLPHNFRLIYSFDWIMDVFTSLSFFNIRLRCTIITILRCFT